ncbi:MULTISPECIES: hypothetical protein [unclassified Streptosporangium]|uniref:hypothetical protein n=1 Tax=unclassified Streptosporangium TaxID=2632669 RepID=UPI002E27F5BE|nr:MULTISPECIES: hypothetical protein [unclassified Streptosporangium]
MTRLYDRFGFDTVDNSPLRESWRSTPGQPAWDALQYQTRDELITDLARARRLEPLHLRRVDLVTDSSLSPRSVHLN